MYGPRRPPLVLAFLVAVLLLVIGPAVSLWWTLASGGLPDRFQGNAGHLSYALIYVPIGLGMALATIGNVYRVPLAIRCLVLVVGGGFVLALAAALRGAGFTARELLFDGVQLIIALVPLLLFSLAWRWKGEPEASQTTQARLPKG